MTADQTFSSLVLVFLFIGAVLVVIAWICAPFMLYAIATRLAQLNHTNQHISVQIAALHQLLADRLPAPPPAPSQPRQLVPLPPERSHLGPTFRSL